MLSGVTVRRATCYELLATLTEPDQSPGYVVSLCAALNSMQLVAHQVYRMQNKHLVVYSADVLVLEWRYNKHISTLPLRGHFVSDKPRLSINDTKHLIDSIKLQTYIRIHLYGHEYTIDDVLDQYIQLMDTSFNLMDEVLLKKGNK